MEILFWFFNLFYYYDIAICMNMKCVFIGFNWYKWISLILCINSEQEREYITEIIKQQILKQNIIEK